MHAHSVFVTTYRHTVFSHRHLTRLEEIMRAVCADFDTEFNGETNHVHPLVNSLTGVSSRRKRQEYPELARHHWRAQHL